MATCPTPSPLTHQVHSEEEKHAPATAGGLGGGMVDRLRGGRLGVGEHRAVVAAWSAGCAEALCRFLAWWLFLLATLSPSWYVQFCQPMVFACRHYHTPIRLSD
jgi:hypothetical protein